MVSIRSGGTGAPPAAILPRVGSSRPAFLACSRSWRTTVGTPDSERTRSVSTRSRASAGSHLYISAIFAPMAVMTYRPVRPPMWKNGKVCSATGCSGSAAAAAASGSAAAARRAARVADTSELLRLVTWLRWVATAPFGRPVVPEV